MFLRYTYDPFGNVTSINAPMTVDIDDLNRYTYNGEDYDYNTCLQYLRARYYDTSVGSFISQDTYLGQTFVPLTQNRYTYAGNNPVMYDDPSGHWFLTVLTLGIIGWGLYSAGEEIVEAHEEYTKEIEPHIEELSEMAEEGKVVDTCGLLLTTIPENVVYDEFNLVYVMYGAEEEAQSYSNKVSELMDLMYARNSKIGHAALSGLGTIPVLGMYTDAMNAGWYLAEGDYANALISTGSIVFEPALAKLVNKVKTPVQKLLKKIGVTDKLDELAETLGIKKNKPVSVGSSTPALPDYSKADYYESLYGGKSHDAISAKQNADQGVSSSNNAESKYYNNTKPNQDISHEFDNIGQGKIVRNPIPNSGNAKIDPRKLTEYALNPNHPVGGNKAKVFDSALGYNQSNADDLIRQIHTQLPDSEAVLGKLDEYGQRYTVDMLIKGPNGNTATVRTGWIIKNGSDNPELTTLWVND